ncbi:oligosaccharide flippase family protein [Lentzea flava]|uniref:Polysaccharide biosynthesis protein n=1 Tax=Lentzea flava TaxID=103732 RepID=A0ABQ2V410_9PSEU|nr:oligosaccharide flippase family protein [Lentzea flava]MCP2203434.1 polysaccharide transporter, PST family [Lentzea flava]GGU67943.1 polysaccharide biosynthesis protein [Lentzea flava]
MTNGVGERAVRGSLWLFAVNVVSKGCQVAVTLVLAALLTEDGLGVVSLVVSLVNIGQVVQSAGVYDVISRTNRDPGRLAGTVLTLSIGGGTVLTAVLLLTAEPLGAALGAPASLIRIAALSLPFTAIGGVQMAMMHRDLDFRRRMLPDAGGTVLGATATIVLAALGSGPLAVAAGLVCTAVAQPVLAVVAGARVRPRWDREAAKEALRWTAVVGPGAVVATLLINVDYLTIGHVLGPSAVGVYSLAFRIAWTPYILVAVVLGGVMFPVCAELVRSGQSVTGAVLRFTKATLMITGGLFTVLALLADHVVLFGERWAPAAPVLMALCAYGLGLGLLHTWYQVIRAAGHARWYLALEVTHLIALLSALALTTRHGVLAVAIAQAVIVWLLVPLTWWVLTRHGLAFPPRELGRTTAGLLTACASCAVATRLLPETGGIAGAVLSGLVLLGVYAAVVLPLNREAVRELRGSL